MTKHKQYTDKVTKVNVFASLILTIVTIISGFIIPRLILSILGSEVNGLYLSLDQYLNFFSLFEGGLGGIVMASLYKPLYEKDYAKVSSIIVTVTKFFRKIAILFIGYLILVSLLYPLIVETSFDYDFVASLSFILGINFFIRYYFLLVIRMLLQADRKLYVTAGIETILILVEILVFIIIIRHYPSIHFIKIVSSFIYIVQFLLLSSYANKNYKIDKQAKEDKELISQRWDGMGIMFAAFIHTNTDLIIITGFLDLYSVSIYTVYNMIVKALRSVIISISSALAPTIGMFIAKDDVDQLKSVYNSYEFMMTFISFLLYTVCAILIVPFVMIYTRGVSDANYYQPLFALLITMVSLQYCLREPSTTILYAANRYKDLRWPAYIEAILNILISIALVKPMGLVGIVIGTMLSIIIRHIFHYIYLKLNIIKRSLIYSLKLYLIFYPVFIGLYFLLSRLVNNLELTYVTWALLGFIVFIVCLAAFSLVSYLFFKKEFKILIKSIRAKV